jgi:hypothetical protein
MLYAVAHPEPEQGKRTDLFGGQISLPASKASISQARTVLREAPDLVDGV